MSTEATDVRAFGAVGDGQTLNTQAIQRAIDACHAQGGGKVVVRNGTYAKEDGPPVADPTLFAHYPSDGLVPGKGTIAPDRWDDSAFLTPIVESINP